jgi:hypothetical protein
MMMMMIKIINILKAELAQSVMIVTYAVELRTTYEYLPGRRVP